ncbi:S26 family signal peptidase, partial [Actinomadura sp. CNU-125]|uniref:S26 family signal peptidase n=1 Tax=Actinomadura sp. CNU-125 TaxID=1904961 RepID=UPI0021CC7B5B
MRRALLLPVVPVVAALAGVSLLRRRFAVIDVSGASMEPAFRTGDRVLVRRVPPRRVRRGDVVVLRAPDGVPPGRTRRA